MSDKYLIVSEPEQVPLYDPQAMAQGLGMALEGFLELRAVPKMLCAPTHYGR